MLLKEAKRLELIEEAKALEAAKSQPEASVGEKVVGAARSAVEGATFGVSEPVFSGLMAAEQHIKKAALESGSPQEFYDRVTNLDSLKAEYQADVDRRRQFESQNPGLSTTAEIAGAVAPALLTMGGSAPASGVSVARAAAAPAEAMNLVGRGASSAVQAIPGMANLTKSAGLAGSAARVAEAGAVGAAQATAAEGAKRLAQEPSGFIRPEDNLPSMGEVALTGGALGGALKAIPEAVSQAGRGAKTAARVLTGVRGEDIDNYLARPEAIRSAKTIEEVKDEVDSAIQKLRDDVDGAKLNREQAYDALRQAESKVDDLVKENKFIVQQKKADIRQQFRDAKASLDRAFKETTSEIKTARVAIRPDDVLDSVEQVKQQVSDLSAESYKILGLHKGKFSLSGVTRQVSGLQNDLKVGGQLLSGDAETAYNVLGKWKEKLQTIEAGSKKGLGGQEVKKIIQELDSDIRQYGDRLAGEFSDKTYNSLMGVRRALDTKIKTQVPGYAQVMEETAKMNELRRDLVKMFGRRESVTSKLSRIDNPNLEYERSKLMELGQTTGKDFSSPLEEYMNLRSRSRTSIDQDALKRGLPGYQPYLDAVTQEARAGRPEFGQSLIEKARTASPEAAALRAATQGASVADEAVSAATTALEPYKRITPQNSENAIRTLLGDRSRKIELRRLMTSLGQVSDQDFMLMINDLKTRDAFEKGYPAGSANVNMWAAIMGVMGGVSGMDPTMGAGSAAAGATIGRFMDSYGPKVTRRVLDGIVFMRGLPTVQKVNALFGDLPPQVTEQLKTDLIRAVTIANDSGSITIPPEDRADVAMDFDSAEHLTSIEKAKAITDLNKNGTITSESAKRLMLSNQKPPTEVYDRHEPQQKLPPTYEQVTDFIKNRKPEVY